MYVLTAPAAWSCAIPSLFFFFFLLFGVDDNFALDSKGCFWDDCSSRVNIRKVYIGELIVRMFISAFEQGDLIFIQRAAITPF